ncbi:hypothetical protein BDN72DRAFT_904938 [Pluteus cervinus]|uniref:Uncharacterized protein n=1 Tax=Pluteus cervinus TaxID=181527 RepID=A0ACD3A458_9AGAR|nr:hypothetical protein BDN72DRAFT_904938 [Pluteus cervinus]
MFRLMLFPGFDFYISDPLSLTGILIQQLRERVLEWIQPGKPAQKRQSPIKNATEGVPASPLTDQSHINSAGDYAKAFIAFIRRLFVFLDDEGNWDQARAAANSHDALVDEYQPIWTITCHSGSEPRQWPEWCNSST